MQVGGTIPLSFQLFDCATNQYVRAWVRKPDGTLVGGAAVNLTQVALGLYQNNSLVFPNVNFVTVQYVVYSDSGYTTISPTQGAGAETIYSVSPVGSVIPLSLQLFDCDDTQYVRAWVRTPDGTLVNSAPVDLTLVALGLYQNFTLVMPAVAFVTVQYVVYSDSGHTVISSSEGAAADTLFQINPSVTTDLSPFTCYVTGVIESDCCAGDFPLADTIIKGTDRVLSFVLKRGPSYLPYDISDVSILRVSLLKQDGTVLIISNTDVTSPISVTNPGGGIFTCKVTAAQSLLLAAQALAPVAITLSFADGSTVACNIPNQLSVQQAAV